MRARSTRLLVLALLFLTLPPGASVAACLQAGPAPCCCTEPCPQPAKASVESGSCCEITDGAALPPTVPATAAPATSPPPAEPGERVDTPHAQLEQVRTVAERGDADGWPSPVPLFTLHSALLI